MLASVPVRQDLPDDMAAWVVHEPGPATGHPLRRKTLPVPQPSLGELADLAAAGARLLRHAQPLAE